MDLADGPLYLHDLLRVERLPHMVVLSACQAAQGDVGAMGDVLGASTVLMERGTATVIANAGLVADNATSSAAMLELHRNLAAGAPAARPAVRAAGGGRPRPAPRGVGVRVHVLRRRVLTPARSAFANRTGSVEFAHADRDNSSRRGPLTVRSSTESSPPYSLGT